MENIKSFSIFIWENIKSFSIFIWERIQAFQKIYCREGAVPYNLHQVESEMFRSAVQIEMINPPLCDLSNKQCWTCMITHKGNVVQF